MPAPQRKFPPPAASPRSNAPGAPRHKPRLQGAASLFFIALAALAALALLARWLGGLGR